MNSTSLQDPSILPVMDDRETWVRSYRRRTGGSGVVAFIASLLAVVLSDGPHWGYLVITVLSLVLVYSAVKAPALFDWKEVRRAGR
jgi:hypothetical protein